ncbi:unnamed protein product [Notodromas monacha]|uniref:Phospholipid-transporting ATPase n=1 Tax=Notodromas monacha TaxID=399045 RepID=A0A7R9BJC0_9CRUS|nr:unnamed protein product [Notodromas monacha]CAG0915171.1 unnamed protein product [Notodromas monacha]
MFSLCQGEKEPELERRIKINDPAFNAQFRYAIHFGYLNDKDKIIERCTVPYVSIDNYIKTSKYTPLTFAPLNLFEQFQRLANFYFLCLLILQLIPIISSLTPITTAVPLIFVLSITAIKDAYDDWQRHRSDSRVNNRKAYLLKEGRLTEERWSRVQVGDIIKLSNDDFVTADLLLLSTSEPNGLCYIETAELDGETNLKSRQCLAETSDLGQDDAALGHFDAKIYCEAPNNNLSRFEGTMEWQGEKFALDNDKVLLRGCILRNTQWCYGVVIFAGKDTKLMMNSGKTKFKRTSIDRLMNVLILGIVFFLVMMCLLCTVAAGIWESQIGYHFQSFLPWDSLVPEEATSGATVIAILIFFSYLIALNTVVPISLYVSVEIIRLAQSLLINWDEKMYYEEKDTPAKARTTTLNEELGQIEYIFSDKTGTLTQNIMTFNKCTVRGTMYGDPTPVIDPRTGRSHVPDLEEAPLVDFSANAYSEPDFKFYDPHLLENINKGQKDVQEFFRLLALCHTVMPEEKNGALIYQAQSPDEAALVSAARNFGFIFKERTPNTITTIEMGEEKKYELLCILDFNNVRKRMSVIIRCNGAIKLYCKGADSIIYERLESGKNQLHQKTLEHLNMFAGEGLRTLVLASKDLDPAFFEAWKKRHLEASVSLDNREERLDAVYEEIERDMSLIGATAIEDKLQDGVPQTIANLAQAGIKIWVLTGDKQETAINIGYSCELLTDDMHDEFIVDASTYKDVETQLTKYREILRNGEGKNLKDMSVVTFSERSQSEETLEEAVGSPGYALVINGHSLVHALNSRMERMFLDVATRSAHIGVGISGQEGLQATLSSDFSICQFRFLERLLLVHGRWSYLRMCKFLRYFFYKNFAFTLCHFWYAFFCGFSAQAVYDPFFISCYNLFYTSMPVLALAVFDQDVNDFYSVKYPKLYTPGIKNLLFNKAEFFKSVMLGVITSSVLFFITYGAYHDALAPEGHVTSDLMLFGSVLATILVIVVTVQVALETAYWTIINFITLFASLLWYFTLTYAYYYIFGSSYIGSLKKSPYVHQLG